jgi:outer membrane receptor protein involved in Fe transport
MALKSMFRSVVLSGTSLFSFSIIAQESTPGDSLKLSHTDASAYLSRVPSDSLHSNNSTTGTSKRPLQDTLIPELQKIIVTSGRRERLLESNRSVLMISPEEWQGTNKSVADVIAEHTGIQTRKYGGMGSFQTVSIRGIKGSEVLVLLDGVPLNSTMGGAVDLGTINPAHLDDIEVYKGVVSTILGGNCLGGVINLRTKPKGAGSVCDVQTEIGSFGKQRITSGVNYSITPEFSIYGAASYNHCENNFPYLDRNNTFYGPHDNGPNDPRNDDTIRTLKNHQYSAFDLTLHPLVILPGHEKRIVGNVYYSNVNRHIPAPESKENETARYLEKKVIGSLALQHDDSTRFQIVPSLGYIFTDGVTRWSERDEGFHSSHGGAIKGSVSSGMAEHSLDGKLEMKYYPFENVKVQALLFCQAGDANPSYYRGGDQHGDWHSRRALGGAAMEIATTIDHLTFSTGGSVSGIYDETDGGLDGVSDHIVLPSDTVSLLWNGEAGAAYKFFDNTKLYINAGHYTNQPSLRERFGGKGAVMANPELTAEEVNTADAGVKVDLRSIYFEGAAFYTRALNTIEFKSDGYLIKPVNNDGCRNYGLEFSSIIELTKYLSVDVAATWQKTKNLAVKYRRRDRMMPDEPEVSIASGVNLEPLKGLTLSYKFQFKSIYFHDLANEDLFRVPSGWNSSGNANGTFSHDVLLSWKVTGNFDIRLSIENIKFGKLQSLENSIEKGYATIITPATWWNFSAGYSF